MTAAQGLFGEQRARVRESAGADAIDAPRDAMPRRRADAHVADRVVPAVLASLAGGALLVMLAISVLGLLVPMGPDESGYLHALHKTDALVFLDHTDQQMLSIGRGLCRQMEDPKGSDDVSYSGPVGPIAYQYLCD